MLESLLNLGRDVFVYGRLLRGLELNGKRLSNASKMKISAFFVDACSFIPVLKYESGVSWSASIFGPQTVVVQKDDSVFNRDVPLNKILENTDLSRWPFTYNLSELSDPILFGELQGVLSALRPGEISWLATHRTLEHTKLCVSNDFVLWKFHFTRILERLRTADGRPIENTANSDAFISAEIDQAAKDIKQVLFKLENRNKLRYRLREKLVGLSTEFPVAQNIANSIEKPRKISLVIILKNEARRNLTSILRLHMSNCGLVPDNRKKKTNSMQSYLNQLETKLDRLSTRHGSRVGALKRAIAENEGEKIVAAITTIFRILASPDDAELWESQDAPLDRWLQQMDD